MNQPKNLADYIFSITLPELEAPKPDVEKRRADLHALLCHRADIAKLDADIREAVDHVLTFHAHLDDAKAAMRGRARVLIHLIKRGQVVPEKCSTDSVPD